MTREIVRTSSLRPLALIAAVLFLLSWVFPLAAGLSRNTSSFPRVWGPLDVALAFLLALLTVPIFQLARGRIDGQIEKIAYRMYRVLTHAIVVVLVVFFLAGDRIVWINWITGFAWRFWLLLYCLPAWLALVKRPAQPPNLPLARN